MSRIITVNNLNRLWQNGVLPIKSKVDGLEQTGGTVTNKLSTYDDVMANSVAGYIPDALAVKEGFTNVNNSLGGVKLGIDGEGNRGYFGADDSFIPFNRTRSNFVYGGIIRNSSQTTTVPLTEEHVGILCVTTNSSGYFLYAWHNKSEGNIAHKRGRNQSAGASGTADYEIGTNSTSLTFKEMSDDHFVWINKGGTTDAAWFYVKYEDFNPDNFAN